MKTHLCLSKICANIFLLAIFLTGSSSYAQSPSLGLCERVFAEQLDNEAFAWFESMMDKHRRRVRGARLGVNLNDIRLMQDSFANKEKGQPIETGLVEVLSADERVLYSTQIIYGRVGYIQLGAGFDRAMNEARYLPEAAKIRTTHTHPPALKGSNLDLIVSVFSQADYQVDRDRRILLDRSGLKHLDLELKIVFIDPKYTEFRTDSHTMLTILRARSYALIGSRD